MHGGFSRSGIGRSIEACHASWKSAAAVSGKTRKFSEDAGHLSEYNFYFDHK